MSKYLCCVLFLLNHDLSGSAYFLLRVALKFNRDDAPDEILEQWFEPENERFLKSMLPDYQRAMPLVDVTQIWDVIVQDGAR